MAMTIDVFFRQTVRFCLVPYQDSVVASKAIQFYARKSHRKDVEQTQQSGMTQAEYWNFDEKTAKNIADNGSESLI